MVPFLIKWCAQRGTFAQSYPPHSHFLSCVQGRGGILIEAALSVCPSAIYFGTDMDERQLEGATDNVASAGLVSGATLTRNPKHDHDHDHGHGHNRSARGYS